MYNKAVKHRSVLAALHWTRHYVARRLRRRYVLHVKRRRRNEEETHSVIHIDY